MNEFYHDVLEDTRDDAERLEDWAIAIARKHAKAKPQSYYSEPFRPHEWVVDAIMEALTIHETHKGALEDIAGGAAMMLDSPPMAAVHRYAAEVKRVADEALGRKSRG